MRDIFHHRPVADGCVRRPLGRERGVERRHGLQHLVIPSMWRAATITLALLLLTGCMSRKEMEKELRDRLLFIRSSIDRYQMDKGRGPDTLDDLVRAGYLKEIPEDPCTGKPDWTINSCEHYKAIPDKENPEPGICDVHSACKKENKGGEPYKDW